MREKVGHDKAGCCGNDGSLGFGKFLGVAAVAGRRRCISVIRQRQVETRGKRGKFLAVKKVGLKAKCAVQAIQTPKAGHGGEVVGFSDPAD